MDKTIHDFDLTIEVGAASDVVRTDYFLAAARSIENFDCAGTFGCAGSFGGTLGSVGTFGCCC